MAEIGRGVILGRASDCLSPIADVNDASDVVAVVTFYRPIEPWWVPPLSDGGLLNRDALEAAVKRVISLPLTWRWASASDWPPTRLISGDFRFARHGGFGFVVDVGEERLFLVPRGWEEPEWSLAAYDVRVDRWRDLGDLEPAPEQWVFPETAERSITPPRQTRAVQTRRVFAGKRGFFVAALLLAAVALFAFIKFSPWVAQDACLDAGGAWHDGRCVHG